MSLHPPSFGTRKYLETHREEATGRNTLFSVSLPISSLRKLAWSGGGMLIGETVVEGWGTESPEAWNRNAVADPFQNLVARTCASPFQPCSPPVVSYAVEVGRKGCAGPATPYASGSKWDFFPWGCFFFVFEVVAFCLERGLGMLPCCLVPLCRLGLRRTSCCRCSFAEELLLLLPAPPPFP